MTGFDLVDEPWVLVLDEDHRCREVSLADTFLHATRWRGLAGELPTQSAAVLRLLLAICHRALHEEVTAARAGQQWEVWWRGGLPTDLIVGYLSTWRHRLDLFHETSPFMQVADLRTATGSTSGLSKLIAEVPDGAQFFTTRAGAGLDGISPAEAARWVVHTHAFDISGIKSGAIGDSRVKGGKGYPIGTGWCGQIGMIIAEGDNLAETLLLNLVLDTPSAAADLAPWEREAQMAAASSDIATSAGPVALLTWQARRLRLIRDGSGDVVDALVCNGDAISAQNRHRDEAMTGWKRSSNQEKKGDYGPVVYMPVRHQPERAVWRGLGGLLAGVAPTGTPRQDSPQLLPPVVGWLSRLVDEGRLEADHPVRFRIVGMEYGSQSSVVSEVVDDTMSVHAAVLTDVELRETVVDAVIATEEGVRALRGLAGNLAQASGGEADGPRARAAERAWQVLDEPFRRWAARLVSESDPDDALARWHGMAAGRLREVGTDLVSAASAKAWRGREVSTARGRQFIDAALAEAWFRTALAKTFDRAPTRSRPSTPTASPDPENEGN